MGLDVSHDAFSGAYSAFHRFRQALTEALGGSYPPHDDRTLDDNLWYWGDNVDAKEWPGLNILFNHSDCDGELTPAEATLITTDLTKLLPKLDAMGEGVGHIASRGGYGEVARRFIAGCELAASQGETMEFR